MLESEPVLYCVDMGTTRTRAWITGGGVVWAQPAQMRAYAMSLPGVRVPGLPIDYGLC